METFHSVVVIGAGAAGLFAGQLLKSQFPDVLVVEAQDRIGGRIKQVTPSSCLYSHRADDSAQHGGNAAPHSQTRW
jgi:cation diffusion facilitator CzcD-associated flavoprotein CzcO